MMNSNNKYRPKFLHHSKILAKFIPGPKTPKPAISLSKKTSLFATTVLSHPKNTTLLKIGIGKKN